MLPDDTAEARVLLLQHRFFLGGKFGIFQRDDDLVEFSFKPLKLFAKHIDLHGMSAFTSLSGLLLVVQRL